MIYDLNSHTQIDKITQPIIALIQPAQTKPPEPIKYQVIAGDTLTSVAEAHQTSIERLWQANLNLTDPNRLEVGQELILPLNTDVLQDRPFPAITPSISSSPVNDTPTISGNSKWSFPYGWCTYFASQQRPDLAVRGNAADWIAWSNSSTPRIGAVAVNTSGLGHVAIVIGIDGNRTLVRHMNWRGFGVVSEDWIDASYWSGYIL